jgi:putative glutamine amidotransferase
MYPDPTRTVLPTKVVHYVEENAANWLMAGGAVVFMIPRRSAASARAPEAVRMEHYVNALDGLVLQGGSDIAPGSYGEVPLQPEWAGDPARDLYELELLREFRRQHKPVLGICRGCQLINIASGGSLYQDLATQMLGSGHHRHDTRYDANLHNASILPGTRLALLYGGARRVQINSIHHQAIKALGKDLVAEALSEPDHLVEAIRGVGADYLVGVQWHPEFGSTDPSDLLDAEPLRTEFLTACELAREKAAAARVPSPGSSIDDRGAD